MEDDDIFFCQEPEEELEEICKKLKLSDGFKAQVKMYDEVYIEHMGIENVVNVVIWQNFGSISEENEVENLQDIGITEEGALEFSDFMKPEITHYTVCNWLYLYLTVTLHPPVPITLSQFPTDNKSGEWFDLDTSITQKSRWVNTRENAIRCVHLGKKDQSEEIKLEKKQAARRLDEDGGNSKSYNFFYVMASGGIYSLMYINNSQS